MNKLTITAALVSILFIGGCSSTPQKTETKAETKAAPKPTETITGREAFQKLYPAARGSFSDAKPVRMESQAMTDANGQDGKESIWRMLFASPGRGKMQSFTWSGSSSTDAPDRGVSHSTEDTFSASNASTQPFDINFLKVDSDEAFKTAQKHGGEKILKKDPKTPVNFLLDWDPRKGQLVWHVIYGQARTTAALVIDVDATKNEFMREEK